MIASSQAATITVEDQAAVLNLNSSIKVMSAALAELRSATSKAQEAGGILEIDSALAELRNLDRELQEVDYLCKYIHENINNLITTM